MKATIEVPTATADGTTVTAVTAIKQKQFFNQTKPKAQSRRDCAFFH